MRRVVGLFYALQGWPLFALPPFFALQCLFALPVLFALQEVMMVVAMEGVLWCPCCGERLTIRLEGKRERVVTGRVGRPPLPPGMAKTEAERKRAQRARKKASAGVEGRGGDVASGEGW